VAVVSREILALYSCASECLRVLCGWIIGDADSILDSRSPASTTRALFTPLNHTKRGR
jgi:hypothetical protein